MKICQYHSFVKTLYVSFMLLCGMGAACATVPPREIYIEAVQARASGDQKGDYDKLLYLASEYPETRAGRRARSSLFSSEILVSTYSVELEPNFISPRRKSMESLPAVVTLLPDSTVTDERVSPYCLLGKSIKLSPRISTTRPSSVRLDIRTFPESSMR